MRELGPGHFRCLSTNGPAGDLSVSSVGVGTYLGPETDAADKEYEDAISLALTLGVNVLDIAINYRNMRSERAVGRAVSKAIIFGALKRSQVVVCTKGGYLSFDTKQPANPRAWLEETYIKPGIFSWSEFAAGCHCMTAPYIRNQLERSRNNLGLETIDVYYVHNPETQLEAVTRQEFNTRIRNAFGALEEACREGKILVYGVATWNGFRVPPGAKGHLSLEDLVNAAKDVGGDSHHFKIIQLPFNLKLQEAARDATQRVNNRPMTVLDAAKELGVSAVASASLMQASLCRTLPGEMRAISNELGEHPTNAQCALQFVRSTPGIMTGLAGMRQVAHVRENLEVLKYPAK
ncbi:hypothetical protein GOP47_0029369 [Adiantum capillus-veneris]|nr:hypothetical protein GOP47_0029369 [Adiantum capillus-veneris]